ncbi:MAG: FAD-binding oxidoreductase [Lachnospiraceae bacterium]|nr:FAD-binding oxidoreductase [Lachnospiraceae bacterium]
MLKYDRIIIGAGLYGLYAALFCAKKGLKVLVLEKESSAFTRATYINQARVHMGYHYPRSLATAVKSAGYFSRFCEDYKFCIHSSFEQIYATSGAFSWTDATQFKTFCDAAGIKCEEVSPDRYFNKNTCDGAFITKEYTYDALILRDYFLKEIESNPNITLKFNTGITKIEKDDSSILISAGNESYETSFVVNATYASVNEIISMLSEDDTFQIKYELCEIILCEPNDILKNVGITVMDGPFFSIMPFGMTPYHSLTSVTFTPHSVSFDTNPEFKCQEKVKGTDFLCNASSLGNCNMCPAKPESAWPYMSHLASKYLRPEYGYKYHSSLFSMKPILKSSEIDDSRPTAFKFLDGRRKESEGPVFMSVLSGKINTIYDMDEYLI